jgi:hypothetical protein
MGAQAQARRRQIAGKGRPMALRRIGEPDLPLIGFLRDYQPQELLGGVQQGDVRVEILAEEIAAAGWTTPPAKPDRLVVDGRSYAIQAAARPVHEGADLIGWSIWARGGA